MRRQPQEGAALSLVVIALERERGREREGGKEGDREEGEKEGGREGERGR